MNSTSLKMLFEQSHIVQLPQINHNIPIQTEGNPASEVIILAKKADMDIATHREMLSKLLQAVKCPLPDSALVMIVADNHPIKIHDILTHEAIKKIIVFGVLPKHIGIFANIRAYTTINMGDQQWLFSENLDAIYHQKEKKGVLWAALQAFFELN